MSDTELLALLTVVLVAVVVLVLAVALILVRKSLARTSAGLATLARALRGRRVGATCVRSRAR